MNYIRGALEVGKKIAAVSILVTAGKLLWDIEKRLQAHLQNKTNIQQDNSINDDEMKRLIELARKLADLQKEQCVAANVNSRLAQYYNNTNTLMTEGEIDDLLKSLDDSDAIENKIFDAMVVCGELEQLKPSLQMMLDKTKEAEVKAKKEQYNALKPAALKEVKNIMLYVVKLLLYKAKQGVDIDSVEKNINSILEKKSSEFLQHAGNKNYFYQLIHATQLALDLAKRRFEFENAKNKLNLNLEQQDFIRACDIAGELAAQHAEAERFRQEWESAKTALIGVIQACAQPKDEQWKKKWQEIHDPVLACFSLEKILNDAIEEWLTAGKSNNQTIKNSLQNYFLYIACFVQLHDDSQDNQKQQAIYSTIESIVDSCLKAIQGCNNKQEIDDVINSHEINANAALSQILLAFEKNNKAIAIAKNNYDKALVRQDILVTQLKAAVAPRETPAAQLSAAELEQPPESTTGYLNTLALKEELIARFCAGKIISCGKMINALIKLGVPNKALYGYIQALENAVAPIALSLAKWGLLVGGVWSGGQVLGVVPQPVNEAAKHILYGFGDAMAKSVKALRARVWQTSSNVPVAAKMH